MQTLSLTGANGVSDILIETGLLDHAGEAILDTFSPSRVHIVSDSTVAPLYLAQLTRVILECEGVANCHVSQPAQDPYPLEKQVLTCSSCTVSEMQQKGEN